MGRKTTLQVNLADVINLTLGGGGAKGFAHVGALLALDKRGLNFKRLRRISGSSAGAIVGGLLGVGWLPQELESLLYNMNFSDFLDAGDGSIIQTKDGVKADLKKSFGIFSPIAASTASTATSDGASQLASEGLSAAMRFGTGFGLFSGELFRKWMEARIKEKSGVDFLTFGELHVLATKEPEKYKDLYITGVDLNLQIVKIFSWETTPHVIISDAVRISMSIPFVFKPHQPYVKAQQPQVGSVHRPRVAVTQNVQRVLGTDQDLYIDGGLLNNIPTQVFDFERYDRPEDLPVGQGMTKKTNFNTLTLRLVPAGNKPKLEEDLPVSNKEIKHLFAFIRAILETIYNKGESDFHYGDELQRTILLGANVGSFSIYLSDEQKADLLKAGKEGVEEVFTQPGLRI